MILVCNIPNAVPAKGAPVAGRTGNRLSRHIVEENPTAQELEEWWKRSGLPLKKFFNTSGNLYKEQNLKDKLPQMSEQEQLQLLAINGMLVKRPLVVAEDLILVGFKEDQWQQLKD